LLALYIKSYIITSHDRKRISPGFKQIFNLTDQIAFFVRHPKNSFVLVAGSPDPELVRLYPGSRILELVDDGLRLEPLASGLAACVALFETWALRRFSEEPEELERLRACCLNIGA
jgi:hypothetical protein